MQSWSGHAAERRVCPRLDLLPIRTVFRSVSGQQCKSKSNADLVQHESKSVATRKHLQYMCQPGWLPMMLSNIMTVRLRTLRPPESESVFSTFSAGLVTTLDAEQAAARWSVLCTTVLSMFPRLEMRSSLVQNDAKSDSRFGSRCHGVSLPLTGARVFP